LIKRGSGHFRQGILYTLINPENYVSKKDKEEKTVITGFQWWEGAEVGDIFLYIQAKVFSTISLTTQGTIIRASWDRSTALTLTKHLL
jgi:hypothetical protein